MGGAESLFGTFTADYRLGATGARRSARRSVRTTAGSKREGALCVSCALLALNGTTNTSGNTTTPSVPGTTTAVLGLPLTAANALDVWSPLSSNRTSAALRSQLLDSMQLQTAHQTIKDFTLKFDGPLFDLPGGACAPRSGGEYIEYTMRRGSHARARHRAGEHELAHDLHRPGSRREVRVRRAAGADLRRRQRVSGRAAVCTSMCPAATTTTAISVDTTNPKYALNWTIVDGVAHPRQLR